ncbi:hypothetical protein niasHT_029974 [Heterodera trifolii]|uniref:BTB domain-containing protein n=1 Tax=Heterodera trifolii TaxID=157864 RepID=A0ABD2JJF2_9BILA
MPLSSIIFHPIQLFLGIVNFLLQLFLFVVTGGRRNILAVPQRQRLTAEERSAAEMEEHQQQKKTAEIYGKYFVIGEHRLSVNLPQQHNANTYYSNPPYSVHARDWIDGKKWEFSVTKPINSQQCLLKLAMLETDLASNPVTAEIVFWQWFRGKQAHILQKSVKVFCQSGAQVQLQHNAGAANAAPSDGFFNVLIRLLEKREHQIIENPCPPCDSEDEVVLKVGPEQFTVSKHFLMSVSPVFHKMFSVDMLEKAQGEVSLEETNGEEFSAFLDAISPKMASPNPANVMGMLKLADRFQVDALRNRCEAHLINCVEISLIERLLCAEMYRLEKLKNFILKSLNGVGMREFYEENQAALNLLSKDLLIQLTVRICSSSKIDRSALCHNCTKNLNE